MHGFKESSALARGVATPGEVMQACIKRVFCPSTLGMKNPATVSFKKNIILQTRQQNRS
jgi:hypothetical protein